MSEAATPSHLVSLARGWSWWKWVGMRGTGFPIDMVLQLAAPAATAATERMLDCEEEEHAARRRAIDAFDAVRNAAPEAERRAWNKVVQALVAKRIPSLPSESEAATTLAPVVEAVERLSRAREEALRLLGVAARHTGEILRQVATDKRFREAMMWQNRVALHLADHNLRGGSDDRTSRARSAEQLIASYLQRYCTKNDTIGFFGPVGWAKIDPNAEGLVAAPGRELLDGRRVFFEYWCIDALGEALGADPELRPWARPRRRPTIRIEADVLHHSLDRADPLPPAFAQALALCDGTLTAHAIANQLTSQTELGLEGVDDALGVLEELAEKRLIIWTFEVPNVGHELGPLLERELLSIEGPGRDRALAAVRSLEEARAEVEQAAGDPERLDRGLAAFEERFKQLTGRDATRNPGKTFGARTLLYEDCRRSGEVTFSASLLRNGLGTSLPLVMASARWYTWEIARRYRTHALELFRAMRAENGTPTIDYQLFWAKLSEFFPLDWTSVTPTTREVLAELQRRWMEILAFDPAEHRVQRSGVAIADAVERAFAAADVTPGYPIAAFQSPDLMIAADNLEAIQRGDCDFVIGEIHTGVLTLMHPWWRWWSPEPEALVAARRVDMPQPIVSHLISKDRSVRSTDEALQHDFHVVGGNGCSWLPSGQVLPVSELFVEELEGALWVCTRDRVHRFEMAEFFAFLLAKSSGALFRMLPRLPHLPRITVDRLVLTRESWSFDPTQLSFLASKGSEQRFLDIRRWARSVGLPRFVFTKVDTEAKPSFLDLDSPISVDIFVRQVAGASTLGVSEMLPTPEQAWLPDAEGRHYVCELRLGALDPLRWTR